MSEKKYLFSNLFLTFYDTSVENLYQQYIIERTLAFCRISWALVFIFGGIWGILDRQLFGESADVVLNVRLLLLVIAGIMFSLSYIKKFKKYMKMNAAAFIFMLGTFCIFLTAMSDRTTFSPYFASLFIAFTGVIITAGLGFKYSIFAFLFNLIIFEVTFGMFLHLSGNLFIIYNFFLPTIILIFLYIGYFIERTSRNNYIISAKLQKSLIHVKKLSGLLPICSSCKKIRDDKGYWNQIEIYIETHSEALFSHGLCHDCESNIYGHQEWYQKKKRKSAN
ncbi:hypothetical protein KAR48_06670 [bacterium]|nr:hypothetical protein [bacterium]